MSQKILFLDVDGTITNYENEIPATAVAAIRAARANGHLVYTVTGRSKAEMYQDILDIGFDGYIGGNGSYIESQGQVVKDQNLTEEDTREIVDWLLGRGLEFYLESNNGLFASPNFAQRSVSTLAAYSANKGLGSADIAEIFPTMVFDGDLYREDLNKISFILDSYQDYQDAVARFPHLKVGTWGGHGETALFGDIALGEINKASAITELLTHLDLEQTETVAFGDAKVDLPMFEVCDLGVALGSGGAEIKAAADFVTDTVDNHGLAKAFKHYQLI